MGKDKERGHAHKLSSDLYFLNDVGVGVDSVDRVSSFLQHFYFKNQNLHTYVSLQCLFLLMWQNQHTKKKHILNENVCLLLMYKSIKF